MRRAIAFWIVIVCFLSAHLLHGQDFRTELQKKLAAQYTTTHFSGDHAEILKTGSVLVFQKPALVMFSTDYAIQPTSVYKNGKLTMGFGTSMEAVKRGDDRVPQRTFVEDEKFWLATADIDDDAVSLVFISDPYSDVRYWTKVKFPINKKAPPTADDMLKTIAEVISVDGGSAPAEAAAAPAQKAEPAPAALAPIAPPPPPVDAPPAQPATISVGQTKQVVVAILGQPKKVVSLGTKEIDIYPDLKITYVNNKVSTVQ